MHDPSRGFSPSFPRWASAVETRSRHHVARSFGRRRASPRTFSPRLFKERARAPPLISKPNPSQARWSNHPCPIWQLRPPLPPSVLLKFELAVTPLTLFPLLEEPPEPLEPSHILVPSLGHSWPRLRI
ncbi:hypothetical protein D1007_51492 [Hordeum vulgare]|nr:hypothetical protein D1007_51492 [Hordeum vulgare]